jgi:L-2,4-diaminobutyric acid acetyltransferase
MLNRLFKGLFFKGGENLLIQQELSFRKPTKEDGAAIWQLVKDSKVLDLNSSYLYIMLSEYFSDTCAMAEVEGELAGFVTGYRLPSAPDTLFVWQIAIAEDQRGKGLGKRLLRALLAMESNQDIKYVEATVSPSNGPSKALFTGLARDRKCECVVTEGFPAELFPKGATHEDEDNFKVGPFKI